MNNKCENCIHYTPDSFLEQYTEMQGHCKNEKTSICFASRTNSCNHFEQRTEKGN